MRKDAFPTKKNSLKTIAIFSIIVFFLVAASLCIKSLFLIRESRFDGNNPFTLAIQNTLSTVQLVVFSPREKTIHIVDISSQKPFHYLQKELGIMIDGQVTFLKKNDEKDVSSQLLTFIFSFNNTKTNVTSIDLARLLFLSKTIPVTNITREKVAFSPTQEFDEKLQGILQDSTLLQERKTIAIVNATGITGFGRRLERLLVTSGGNVISVTTSQDSLDASRITIAGKSSYTSEKIRKSLHLPVSVFGDDTFSDIIITLGRDSIDTTLY